MPDAGQSVLPIKLPPATLRPLAFRVFTKKHDLTLTSSALASLAQTVGKYCGSEWREKGLAEKVLDEAARAWRGVHAAVIVDGDADDFQSILKDLEECILNGQISNLDNGHGLASVNLAHRERQQPDNVEGSALRPQLSNPGDQGSGISADEAQLSLDPRHWLAVVDAFAQPRWLYDASKGHFNKVSKKRSALPDPTTKTDLYCEQYDLVHQRLLKTQSFRTAKPVHSHNMFSNDGVASLTTRGSYKLTPITNLLGRGGSKHILLGLLVLSPTGSLVLSDLSGSVLLDLTRARPIPADGAWFGPGMHVVVEGIYMEEGSNAALTAREGVGGTIGGKFLGLSVGGPPCERRDHTLGIDHASDSLGSRSGGSGGAFGWVDFTGSGSEKTVGARMRKQEKALANLWSSKGHRAKIVIMGDLELENPRVLQALRKILGKYSQTPAASIPMAFVLAGNFAPRAAMAGAEAKSKAAYEELFDSLASILSEFPVVLRATKFIFVPGDKDPWVSAFSGGAATLLPRKAIPQLFTASIRKAFTLANTEVEATPEIAMNGDAIWTTNPSRITFLGPVHEIVVFRDDLSSRVRRNSIQYAAEGRDRGSEGSSPDDTAGKDAELALANQGTPTAQSVGAKVDLPVDLTAARKIVKTLLDQGHLSPFPMQKRPVLWEAAGSLRLYPLPTALILIDPEVSPFSVTYEGCHVMNPGKLILEGRKNLAKWIEYDVLARRSQVLEADF